MKRATPLEELPLASVFSFLRPFSTWVLHHHWEELLPRQLLLS
jgi:hypothetical protein